MLYKECPNCGASLDPGEKCDCAEKEEACTATTVQTSKVINVIKKYPDYTTEQGGVSR